MKTAAEYAALAEAQLDAIADARTQPDVDEHLATATVYATLALAAATHPKETTP